MHIKAEEVYAFVANGTGGNKAGVVLDSAKLSDEQMQYVARLIGASETAFVLSDKDSTHKVRFFTPTAEVTLCGHATIATWALMHKKGLHSAGSYTQNTLSGIIKVSVGVDGLIFMEQPVQEFKNIIDFTIIADTLGINEDMFDKSFKPQIVQSALMLGIKSKESLNSLNINSAKLIELNKKYSFKGLHAFVMLNDKDILASVRFFDPIVGIDEDAATGTSNGSFLTYLRSSNALPSKEIYKIEQGEKMGQLSHLYGKFENDRVWVGGKAQDSISRQIELL